MRQCKCGSYAINDDPKRAACDSCWRDAKIAALESEVAALRAVYSIAIKALCDIDSVFPDHRTIAADALLRVERGANKTEGGEE